jgi:hypothetical protein
MEVGEGRKCEDLVMSRGLCALVRFATGGTLILRSIVSVGKGDVRKDLS